jgi:hypothetical protein
MKGNIPARTGFLATSRRKSGRGDIVVDVLCCCLCCKVESDNEKKKERRMAGTRSKQPQPSAKANDVVVTL